MVITKEVLDRFFREQEAKPVDLISFFDEEVSPFVLVAVKTTVDLFLKEPTPQQLVTAFLTLFLLCYKQRNKPLKEWVDSDLEEVLTKKEKEMLNANTPWIEEQAGSAYLAFIRRGSALSLLAVAFFMVHTCIQMQKEITENERR